MPHASQSYICAPGLPTPKIKFFRSKAWRMRCMLNFWSLMQHILFNWKLTKVLHYLHAEVLVTWYRQIARRVHIVLQQTPFSMWVLFFWFIAHWHRHHKNLPLRVSWDWWDIDGTEATISATKRTQIVNVEICKYDQVHLPARGSWVGWVKNFKKDKRCQIW